MGLRSNQVSVLTNAGTASVDLTTTDGSTLLAGGVGVMKMMQLTPKTTNGAAFYDFTGIPAWAKKITLMFDTVSTNGTSQIQLQVGSGSITTTGYASQGWAGTGSSGVITSGLCLLQSMPAVTANTGNVVLTLSSSNKFTMVSNLAAVNGTQPGQSAGGTTPVLSGTLDRIRLTTVNGTDLFDNGSVSVLVEGY